jgi:uncharacterized protein YjiS (DUF1127 family)
MASHALDTAHVSIWAQLSHAVAERRERFAEWRKTRARLARVARELNSYTDRELFDLGIQRADFAAILNGTYRR